MRINPALLIVLHLFPIFAAAGPAAPAPDGVNGNPNPRAYNATFFTGQPSVEEWRRRGVEPLRVVYEGELWARDEERPNSPHPGRLRAVLNRIPAGTPVVVFNVEHWPLTDPSTRQKHVDLIRAAQAIRPDVRFGTYGVCETSGPHHVMYDHYRERREAEEQQVWDMTFAKPAWNQPPIADGPLAVADVVCPSVYGNADTPEQTERYVDYIVRRWMTTGRPVVPFIDVTHVQDDQTAAHFEAKLRACRKLGVTPCLWGALPNPDPKVIHPVGGPLDPNAKWLAALQK